MIGRKRGGPSTRTSSAKLPPNDEDGPRPAPAPPQAGLTTTVFVTDGGQEVAMSQFVAQLDEAARKRLESMNQRLRWLEQQMETLEAEVEKASAAD